MILARVLLPAPFSPTEGVHLAGAHVEIHGIEHGDGEGLATPRTASRGVGLTGACRP